MSITNEGVSKISLYGFSYWRFDGTVRGISPLLQHNPASMQKAPAPNGRGKNIPTPEAEAEASVYRTPSGELYVQTISLRNCVLNAAARGGFTVRKKSLKVLLSGGMLLEPEETLLLKRNGVPIADYEIDMRRAVVQRQGITRSRAKIPTPWELSFTVLVDATLYQEESSLAQLAELFTFAGQFVGIGDYRPEKTGWFGKFVAEFPGLKGA